MNPNILEGLNEGQKELASFVDGSVLATASAGSGKTTTITKRIMYLLENTDLNPADILCLTFTDAGAVSMRQKLLSHMGPDAYKITISTFHAFCNDVIQNNLSYFGIQDMEPISNLEEISFVRKIINMLPSGHSLLRTKGDKYFDVPRILNLFSMMKKENLSSDVMNCKIEEFLENLPYNEDFLYKRGNKKLGVKKGDVNTRKVNEVKSKLDILRSAVGLYDVYNNMLIENKRYDFNDMIQWVIQAFNDNEDILRDYQERYLYLISDEAQDTSGAQHAIMNKLMDYWDDPNMCLIGDVNQTIYSFNGASIQRITDFVKKYNPVKISLNKNYRSTQQIVDASIKVIQKSKINYGETGSDLNIKGMNQDSGDITAICYQSFTHENFEIANKIKELIDSGVTPAEIFVIYRKHLDGKRLYDRLYDMGIPVNTKRRINVLNEHIIVQILSIMEYVNSSFKTLNSDKFFEILHYDFANISRKQIEKLLVMKQSDPDLNSLDKRSFKDVNGFIKVLEELEHISHNCSVLMFVSHILYNTGLRDILLENKDSRSALILRTFYDFVKQENEKNPIMTLSDFLEFINIMRSNNISVNMDDVSGDADGVYFTTAHGSKGLEAEHVFMIRCNRTDWEKSRARSNDFYIPENITFSTTDEKEEESRRLFYVAMTRAKTHLYMSCAKNDDKSKNLEPSLFLIDSEINIQDAPVSDLFEQLISDIEIERFEFTPKIETDRIQSILDNFRMSPTSLNSYIKCPLTFYYERILKVPFMDSYPISYGTLFHRVIEESKKRMASNNFNLDEVIEFGNNLIDTKLSVSLTQSEKFRLKAALKETFPGFYQEYLSLTSRSIPEYKIRDVVIEGVPTYGELDDVELTGGSSAVVTDYKSGSIQNIKSKMKPVDGDIWRQLCFYKLLLENHPKKNISVKQTRIVGINKEPFVLPYEPDSNDLHIVKTQIKEAYSGIMNMKFDGCGDPECKWCNIIKH